MFGVTLIVGVAKMGRWMMQRQKLRGTILFVGGVILVLIGWAFIGLIIEVIGFVSLFGSFSLPWSTY